MEFRAPATHGFIRAAACTPKVALGNPATNALRIQQLAAEAAGQQARLIVFPELSISGYANDDLFFQDALLDAVEDALFGLLRSAAELPCLLVVGAPLRAEGGIFNCAIAMSQGELLAAVPKTYLPNYREFYEKRYFISASGARQNKIRLCGGEIPFGTDILLTASGIPHFSLHIEICEDLWVPIPPSTRGALAGATLIANLSASNAAVGKQEYRKLLVASQSGRCIAGYVYCAAGYGESTTDLAWDGPALIYENGELLAEADRFGQGGSCVLADIDLDRLRQDRARMTSFADCAQQHAGPVFRFIDTGLPSGTLPGRLFRSIDRFPFIPSDPTGLAERCAEIYAIQAQGLARRLEAAKLRKVVIGLSGGADSSQALLVAIKAFDMLGYSREGILCFFLTGFATSEASRTRANALAKALDVPIRELDVRPSAMQMLRDIAHPYAEGQEVYDVTFENVQAGERSSHLFRLANYHQALVVGTNDLSELALGYTTYGVGDQMSHYAVNASIPKTLVRHLLTWCAREGGYGEVVAAVIHAILKAAASPELVPQPVPGETQRAETEIGPYALVDFFLYYISRFGYRPSKVAFLAEQAWSDPCQGQWPPTIPPEERVTYDLVAIKYWLEIFVRRFFGESQFKRSALPNGPKVGSGGCLSPRADWRAPSDMTAELWLAELARNVP